ncbi:efflux RND transporter periplasmic adaptor subunit [bacterium]|nr:efflux RND transporter periplasmic adaptor subunit [bacterium]
MKQQIKLWTGRTFMLVAIIFAAQYWGVPLYRQYMVPKKTEAFVPTAKVKAGDFTISFHEIGTLEAENSVPIVNEVNGKIIYLAPEGTVVSPGDKLVQLDTSEIERDAKTQELNYQNALADVKRVKSEMEILAKSNETEVEQQQADLDFNKSERERANEQLKKKVHLAEEKLIARDQVDQAEMDLRSKDLTVKKGEMTLELKRKEVANKQTQKEADVRNKEFTANMSKASLEEVQGRIKKAVITAPSAGMVVISKDWTADGRRKLKEGDSLRPRQIVCQLPDLSSMQVRLQVGESDAPKLRLGLPVLIRLEAIPDKVFHGTVKEISSLAVESNVWEGDTPGRKNFEVVITVKENDPKTIKPGMSADAEFICDSQKKAIFVPIESVVERSGKTYVFVKDGKRYVMTRVKTGKHNDNFICITKGLKAGRVIALRDPTKPLDQQESGAKGPGAKKEKQKEKKKPAPLPGGSGD